MYSSKRSLDLIKYNYARLILLLMFWVDLNTKQLTVQNDCTFSFMLLPEGHKSNISSKNIELVVAQQ